MKRSLREECIPLSVKTSSCTKILMKCAQNLQNVAGDHGWDDLLYKLRQGKFSCWLSWGGGGVTGSLKKREENDYLEYIVWE